MLPDILLDLGKKAYSKKDYVSAYHNLNFALKLAPLNRDIRYYLVETLINLKPTLYVQRELYNISQVNQPDSADLIADRKISQWRSRIILNAGENYIEQAPFNNKILRWDASKFPLKVYIKNNSDNAPNYYETEIKKAFIKWQASTGNFIRFTFVDNPDISNINASINSSSDMKKCTQDSCKYTIAYTIPEVQGELLKKMDIFFYDSNNLGKSFSPKEIYNTALHEIGHSLGIMGHSYNKDNIMYMESDTTESFDKFRSELLYLSAADINTISLLYKLIPDITNTSLDKFNTNHQFFAPIIMGTEEQINSRKIIEAKNYINSAPEIPNGYIDLSASFMEQKQYNNAIEALNKALPLCSNNNEKFFVYYNYAVIYMKIKDWENTLKYVNLAKKLKPSEDIDGLAALAYYNLENKKEAKKAYRESLKKHPENIINSYNLAVIYLKELNFIQAGKVLNELIKANPEAKDDPKIKSCGLLIFLFR